MNNPSEDATLTRLIRHAYLLSEERTAISLTITSFSQFLSNCPIKNKLREEHFSSLQPLFMFISALLVCRLSFLRQEEDLFALPQRWVGPWFQCFVLVRYSFFFFPLLFTKWYYCKVHLHLHCFFDTLIIVLMLFFMNPHPSASGGATNVITSRFYLPF